jgi:hypothetical protein
MGKGEKKEEKAMTGIGSNQWQGTIAGRIFFTPTVPNFTFCNFRLAEGRTKKGRGRLMH